MFSKGGADMSPDQFFRVDEAEVSALIGGPAVDDIRPVNPFFGGFKIRGLYVGRIIKSMGAVC